MNIRPTGISCNISSKYKLNTQPVLNKNFATQDKTDTVYFSQKNNISFKSNPLIKIRDFARFIYANKMVKNLKKYVDKTGSEDNFILREYCMEPFEGLQYGIKAFEGLSMKDIQYLSENLHVIAVNRGCNNMCGYCYADAKPSNRQMSWEDFTTITQGFKELKDRFRGLDIYGENLPISKQDLIYRTTELFYDSDCIDITVKDKKGKIYDFIDLADELYDSMGRHSVFDTSGWNKDNPVQQKRAEKYASYYSKPENMQKLAAFNVSFNVFNATYIAAQKALKRGDIETAEKLEEKFIDRMVNTLLTFTPLINSPRFHIMVRCFDSNVKNAEGFDKKALRSLIRRVYNKIQLIYVNDYLADKKMVKTEEQCEEILTNLLIKMDDIETDLNSSGRMKDFMKEFGIEASLREYDDSMQEVVEDLKRRGRHHRYIMHRLIDADGKVYHMNYARFIPTEIQLNIDNKTSAPKLANIQKDFVLTKEIVNRPEIHINKIVEV